MFAHLSIKTDMAHLFAEIFSQDIFVAAVLLFQAR